jgi:hypothetical protein
VKQLGEGRKGSGSVQTCRETYSGQYEAASNRFARVVGELAQPGAKESAEKGKAPDKISDESGSTESFIG